MNLLRMVMNSFHSEQAPAKLNIPAEKELVRYAISNVMPLRPKDVVEHFSINHRTAVQMLQKVCAKGWMTPIHRGKSERVTQYELVADVLEYF